MLESLAFRSFFSGVPTLKNLQEVENKLYEVEKLCGIKERSCRIPLELSGISKLSPWCNCGRAMKGQSSF